MERWDHTTDFLVVGSGGGGMTAALAARYAGLDVLVIEKGAHYGGSTALSGGGLWIPNNHLLAGDGVTDSPEQARTYLQHTVGDRTPWARQEAYMDYAPRMIEWLRDHTHVRFQRMPGYSDYYPERPGGLAAGRSLEPVPFNGAKLGSELDSLHPPNVKAPTGLAFSSSEYGQIGMITSTWSGKRTALQVGVRHLLNILAGERYLTMGQALIARLRYSMLAAGIPLWPESPFKELIVHDGAVCGVVIEREGRPIRIQAIRGIVLAAGGFPHNADMRQTYLPQPTKTGWSVANCENTGDAIQAGMAIGAAIDLMEDAWWGPTSLPPGENPFFHVGERGYPGGLLVNSAGRRFVNESAPYIDVVHAMYAQHSEETPHIPAVFIFDQRYRRKYLFGRIFPGQPWPGSYLQSGYVRRAESLAELAGQLGIDRDVLEETISRFNRFAREGVDQDFGRGDSAYDNYYGDPTVKPNPNLAPLASPPFYAVEMVPGELGTKGGLVTDEHARVLRGDGSVISGLYAVGNSSASVMGHSYPGAGATIGPAMTFGYLAGQHASGAQLPAHNTKWPEMREDNRTEQRRKIAIVAGAATALSVGLVLAARRK